MEKWSVRKRLLKAVLLELDKNTEPPELLT